MSYQKLKKEIPYKDIFYKLSIFIATVTVIVYFLPREARFNYQFDIDKPWKYSQLMATFDFPIYKDDAVIQKEQDSLRRSFKPYFILQRENEKEALDNLRKNYTTTFKKILPSSDYLQYIERTLRYIYERGVVSNTDALMLEEDGTTAINIIENKSSKSEEVGNIFTAKKAYAYLLSSDSVNFRPEVLRQCGLNEYISPNLAYDAERTDAVLDDVQSNYSWANGVIQSGQKVIDRGEIVTADKYRILESLRRESLQRSETLQQSRLVLVGQIIFVAVFILFFMLYIAMFRKDFYKHRGSLLLIFTLVVLFCVSTSIMVERSVLNVNVLPFAMMAIMIRVFLDSRTAFLSYIITILICSINLRLPHEFILIQMAGGMMAIFSLRELSQRSQLFRTALFVTLTYFTVYFAYELMIENDFSKMNRSMYIIYAVNGVLLLFTYPLLFALEKIFGFTSNVTLVELSNINNELLRRMAETVPGTFQHSMQVANLAAEAANRIGASSQLVRTGALYHDIGKMENPAFFTENQSGGVNPHKNLSHEQSAQVVINHVNDGVKLAEKHNLPGVIKEFITSHHGHGKTKYFLISWMNEHPGETPDENKFTYPGKNPTTKETAILMMADSVEAASRSLTEYTEESISNLVDKIIDAQVAEGYFKDCPITFKEIEMIKTAFKDKLKVIHHTRISYPELKK